MTNRKWLTTGLLAGTLFLAAGIGAPASAQDVNTGNVSFNVGADVTTHYFFRGVLQEDSGFIFQPYADATFDVYEGDGTITDVAIFVGTWNSLHSKQTGASGTNSNIFETDYFIGVSMGLFENLTADISYVVLTSPNNAFSTVEEIDINLAYDDSGYWGETDIEGFEGLQPYVLIVFEIDNSRAGPDEGIYAELGIEPSMLLVDSEDYPITLSVPVAIGLNIDDYYIDTGGGGGDGDTFGFFSIAAVGSTPLSFIDSSYGSWELSAGVELLILGDDLETINNGDDVEVIAKVGASMTY